MNSVLLMAIAVPWIIFGLFYGYLREQKWTDGEIAVTAILVQLVLLAIAL